MSSDSPELMSEDVDATESREPACVSEGSPNKRKHTEVDLLANEGGAAGCFNDSMEEGEVGGPLFYVQLLKNDYDALLFYFIWL